jgi:hypothetical protein
LKALFRLFIQLVIMAGWLRIGVFIEATISSGFFFVALLRARISSDMALLSGFPALMPTALKPVSWREHFHPRCSTHGSTCPFLKNMASTEYTPGLLAS